MTRRILIAALLLVPAPLALGASSDQPRSHRIDRCGANGGRTLMANRSVRLYFIRTPLGNRYLRTCWIPTGRTSDLTTFVPPLRYDLPQLRIAGRYAASAHIDFDRKQPTEPGVWLTVAVRDVKGGCVRGFQANPPDADLSYRYVDGHPGVTDLEVTSQGDLAWIVSGRPNRDDYFYVQKVDAGGRAVLDEGTAIGRRSLAISGGRSYWMNGAEPRSASLDGLAHDEDCAGSRWPSVPNRPRAYRIDRCADNGGRTLLANRWVRVYVTRDRLDNEYLRYCWVRSGRTSTLVAQGDSATVLVPEYRIAGRYLGSAGIDFDRRAPEFPGVDLSVAIRDVKRDRCVTGFLAQPPNSSAFRYDDRTPGVTDLELSSEGALAWIVSGPPNRDDYFYVQRADAAGKVVLDEGAAIDPRSLAISGRRIYWMNGDTPRSAVLDGRARNAVCP